MEELLGRKGGDQEGKEVIPAKSVFVSRSSSFRGSRGLSNIFTHKGSSGRSRFKIPFLGEAETKVGIFSLVTWA